MDGWNENARTRIESVPCLWYRTREVEHDDHSLELELWRVWISAPPTLFAPGGGELCVSVDSYRILFLFFSQRDHLSRDLKSGAILNCDVSLLLDFEIPSDCHKGERKSITRSS
jgi:hypothetical protein